MKTVELETAGGAGQVGVAVVVCSGLYLYSLSGCPDWSALVFCCPQFSPCESQYSTLKLVTAITFWTCAYSVAAVGTLSFNNPEDNAIVGISAVETLAEVSQESVIRKVTLQFVSYICWRYVFTKLINNTGIQYISTADKSWTISIFYTIHHYFIRWVVLNKCGESWFEVNAMCGQREPEFYSFDNIWCRSSNFTVILAS